jgi:ferredoxin
MRMKGRYLGKALWGLTAGVAALWVAFCLAEGSLRPKPSTRRLWREARRAGLPWWALPHTYAYARWPNGYIGAAVDERWQLRLLRSLAGPFLLRLISPHRWADEYHGKVMPTASARRLVEIREPVQMTLPEQIIPFENARDLVLSHPSHIVVLDCPCRSARVHPCQPVDVCMIVGEPMASFVLEHRADKCRAITAEEAVQILEAEATRGHVHHAFFKQSMLDRFYALCNCCSCCCGAMSAQRSGVPMLISSGYVAQVDEKLCQACGVCVERCPFQVITLAPCATIDTSMCMGCGVCVRACPADAVTLVRDASKPAPLEWWA